MLVEQLKTTREKEKRKYPNGTLLCSHRCVQPKPLLGMTSDCGEASSFKEIDLAPPSKFCFWFWDARGAEFTLCIAEPCLPPPIIPVNSGKPRNGLNGEVGAEFNETTEGG